MHSASGSSYCFLPHSLHQRVSSIHCIRLTPPHPLPSVHDVSRSMSDALRGEWFIIFFSAQHISKATLWQSRQRSMRKYEPPHWIWHIFGGETDCWRWSAKAALKPHITPSLKAAYVISTSQGALLSADHRSRFLMWEAKKKSTFHSRIPAVFNQCKEAVVESIDSHTFFLAKKVKLSVQPYVSLNDPENLSVLWSPAGLQVLLMYSWTAIWLALSLPRS